MSPADVNPRASAGRRNGRAATLRRRCTGRRAALQRCCIAASVVVFCGGVKAARSTTFTGVPSRSAAERQPRRCQLLLQALAEETSVADAPADAAAAVSNTSATPRLKNRLRDRLASEIAKQEAEVEFVPTESQKTIVRQDVDINGIDPVVCVLGSVLVAAVAYGFWTLTGAAAAYFVAHPIESEFYPVQRLGIAFQTAVVGLSSLAAGIFGFSALGILLLGLQVAWGVATGELDPNKKTDSPQRQTTAERVRDFLTEDPVEVAKRYGSRSSRKGATQAGP